MTVSGRQIQPKGGRLGCGGGERGGNDFGQIAVTPSGFLIAMQDRVDLPGAEYDQREENDAKKGKQRAPGPSFPVGSLHTTRPPEKLCALYNEKEKKERAAPKSYDSSEITLRTPCRRTANVV